MSNRRPTEFENAIGHFGGETHPDHVIASRHGEVHDAAGKKAARQQRKRADRSKFIARHATKGKATLGTVLAVAAIGEGIDRLSDPGDTPVTGHPEVTRSELADRVAEQTAEHESMANATEHVLEEGVEVDPNQPE